MRMRHIHVGDIAPLVTLSFELVTPVVPVARRYEVNGSIEATALIRYRSITEIGLVLFTVYQGIKAAPTEWRL